MEGQYKHIQWVLQDRYRIFQHILFWILVYLDEFLSLFGITESFEEGNLIIFEFLADVAMVYVNLYILIPYLLLRNKPVLYGLASLFVIFLNIAISFYLYYPFDCIDCRPITFFAGSFMGTLTLLGSAVGINIFKRFIRNQRKILELETSGLKTELAYLKNQINPHFFFNALNNIYVQIKTQPGDAGESVLLLSDLMRYQLYDCAQDKVKLRSEIEYLENYLKLDRIRKSGQELQFVVNGDLNGKIVAPFIFIPFLENAVKHGGIGEGGFIRIRFDIGTDELTMHLENSKANVPANLNNGGIGLTNVKRRLGLLYQSSHELKISDEKNIFKVELTIKGLL